MPSEKSPYIREKKVKKKNKVDKIICDIRKCKYKVKDEYYCKKNKKLKHLGNALTMEQLRSGFCIWE